MVAVESNFGQNTLKTWSADPQAEARRLTKLSPELRQREFFKNLDTYTNEVIENQPVSLLYNYWFDTEGHLFTGPERLPIQRAVFQIDNQERHGWPRKGFEQVETMLLDNPGDIILWYSPKGQASFTHDPDNPYSAIIYEYGQLYIQNFDGDKVNAVAIKVSNETAIKTLFQKAGAPEIEDKEESYITVRNYLLSPYVLPMTMDGFLDYDWDLPLIFTDKQQHSFYWSDIAERIQVALGGETQKKPYHQETSDMLNMRVITQEETMRAYLLTIRQAMNAQGVSQLTLSGCAGRSQINKGDIDTLLGLKKNFLDDTTSLEGFFGISLGELTGIYSSGFRIASQTKKTTTYKRGTCVDCHMDKDQVGNCGICTDCENNYD